MNMSYLRPVCILAAFAGLAACGQAPDSMRSTLPPGDAATLLPQGGVWSVSMIDDVPLVANNGILIKHEGDRLVGTTSCNRFSAPLRATDDGLSVGPVALTRMACLGAAANHETALIGALDRIDGVAQDSEGQTVLTRSGIPSIILTQPATRG